MSLGYFIKKKRQEKNLSLRQLASGSGVSHSYLSQVEADKFTPHPDWLKKIAKSLGLDPDALMRQAGFIAQKGKDNFWWQEGAVAEKLTGGQVVRFPIGPKTVLPIIGYAPANNLKQAFESPLGDTPYINKSDFAIQVKGDSLIKAGIFDKDICYIKKQSRAKPGDLVLALMGDEVTLRFYNKKDKVVILKPANPKYTAISSSDIKILGVKIAILRRS